MSEFINLSLEDTMSIPLLIDIVPFDNRYLVISPETAKWFVLDCAHDVELFKELRGKTIQHLFDYYPNSVDDILDIIYRIKQMRFDTVNTISCTTEGKKHLHFYLTNKCNLSCPHCYMYSGESSKEELSTEEVITVLENFMKSGGEKVTFSGGEVSTRSDFLTLVKKAKEAGLSVRVLTNGVRWSKEQINSISPLIDSIQISIDGFDEISNSAIRGKGNFEKALHTVDSFHSLGNNVEIAITPFYNESLKDKIDLFAEFIKKLLHKYNNGHFKINIAKEIIKGRNVDLTKEQLSEYKMLMEQLHHKIYGENTTMLNFFKSFSGDVVMDNCMYGIYSVSANGNVYMCSRVSELTPIGNVKTMSFEEIALASKKAEALSNINNLSPCKSCNLKYICGGGCRIEFFPTLTSSANIFDLSSDEIAPRKCNKKEKEFYYELMMQCADYMCSKK